MKSLKTKIILAVALFSAISLSILGFSVIKLMENNTLKTLNTTMTQTATTAGMYMSASIDKYIAVLDEIAQLTRLVSSDYKNEEKGEIISAKATNYGYESGSYITVDGFAYPQQVDVSNRDYFIAAKQGKTFISDPFYSDAYKKMVMVAATPVMKNNQIDAVVTFIFGAEFISQITDEIKVGQSGTTFAINKDGYKIAHKNRQLVNDRDNDIENVKTNDNLKALVALEKKMMAGETGFGEYEYNGVRKFMCYTPIHDRNGWSIAVTVLKDEFMASTQNAIFVVIGLVLLALIIGILVAITLANSVTKPIKELELSAKEIANGNLNINLSANRKDEIGSLIASFVGLRDTIIFLNSEIKHIFNEYVGGEIESRIDETQFNGAYRETVSFINLILTGAIADTLLILDGFGEIGKGNFNVVLQKLPGKKIIANNIFDSIKDNLKVLNNDVMNLIQSALEGNLQARVNTEIYKGDWKKLTEGLNSLVHAVDKPIEEASILLAELSQGNFNVTVKGNYKGSFHKMMKSFEKMINDTNSYISEISSILQTISSGDLQNRITREYVGQYSIVRDSINDIVAQLRETMVEIRTSADNVLLGAKQISETSMDLANGSSSQASSVEELNASIAVIYQQIQQTAHKTQEANEYSKRSIQSANDGNGEMIQMLRSMEEIEEASRNISKIIKVIDDIAFQTNLLALNAAVEAARAGQMGKGFAVVAEEVRSLAGRSSQAAKDTSVLIEDTINKIHGGTEIARSTAESLTKIVSEADTVSRIVNDVFIAAKQQADGISQITTGINQISEVVQSNSSTSEESAAAAEELNSQSEILAQMVAKFRV